MDVDQYVCFCYLTNSSKLALCQKWEEFEETKLNCGEWLCMPMFYSSLLYWTFLCLHVVSIKYIIIQIWIVCYGNVMEMMLKFDFLPSLFIKNVSPGMNLWGANC